MSAHPHSLWTAFTEIAKRRQTAPALLFADETVSFAELEADAERASGWLTAHGVTQGDIVALQLPKRRETYALWLGALRIGAPYTFIDPANPAVRTEAMLARLKPRLFVTFGEEKNPFGATKRLAPELNGADWIANLTHPSPPAATATGADPAYVMFTSGSTGEPKGAVIAQRGVLNLRDWARSVVGDPFNCRFSAINPLHFDNSVFDLYGGLLNGASLVPVETFRSPNPARWMRQLRDAETNVIFSVPTLFMTLDQLGLLTPASLPSARLFLFGGEGYPVSQLRAFHERFAGQARLVNVYGPTETSCICSSLEVTHDALDEAGAGLVSLGRMHPTFDHSILTADAKLVKTGEVGELWIGGANVGLGYYDNPEETARWFCQDPRQSSERSVWYRSGDLVREDVEGQLWFCGRADNQVKIRGYRIELEEIDLTLERMPDVSRAVTVAVDGPDGPELRARFVAQRAVPAEEIDAIFQALPHYMRPAEALQVESLPTSANGKIDRKAVKALLEGGGA